MTYAWLNEEKNQVINVIELNPEQADEFPECVSSDDLPVAIGDEYRDGKFYRNGLPIDEEEEQEEEA